MVNENKMVIARPKNCLYCEHGYYALRYVVDYARTKQFDVTDLPAEQADPQPIQNALSTQDPKYFYGFGHGNNDTYSADSQTIVFNPQNSSLLSNRIVYLLSCLTANTLGPSAVQNGCEAYIGFVISWSWTGDRLDGDPFTDTYAKGFWESANEVWNAIIEGNTVEQAVQRSIDKYDYWINYWANVNPNAPKAAECIGMLAYDRDGLALLNQGNPTPPEQPIQAEGTGDLLVPGLLLLAFGAIIYLALKREKHAVLRKPKLRSL